MPTNMNNGDKKLMAYRIEELADKDEKMNLILDDINKRLVVIETTMSNNLRWLSIIMPILLLIVSTTITIIIRFILK